nr:hypothetical protein [Tanacetum cinerariifolium]
MIVEQLVAEGADKVHDEGVPAAGIVVEGDVSAANDEVPTAVEEPSIPSPKPPIPPPQPSHDIPSTSQVQPTPPESPQVQPQSPQQQPQPSQDGGIIANINADEDVVQEDAKDVTVDAKDGQAADVEDDADIQRRTTESQAQIYQIDLEHANKVLSMQDEEESEPAELQEVVDVVTTAKIITEVVSAASDTITAASTTITAANVPLKANLRIKIITFTTTQLILLVEKRYPLTRFTLDQMINNVRLKVEEESKVSLELLRFIRQQHQEGAQLE